MVFCGVLGLVQPYLFDLELSFQAVIDQKSQAFAPTYFAMKVAAYHQEFDELKAPRVQLIYLVLLALKIHLWT